MNSRVRFLLFFIVLLSFFLRFWRVSQIPQGFHADEAVYGYNAYSLLKTGKDEYGKFLPLILRSFDDYKGAVYSYLTIPYVAIFGLNEFSVRLPSVIFGAGFTLLAYLVTFELTKKRKLAVTAAFLSAVSPVSIGLSRVQSDPLVAVFFVFLSFYFFLKWVKNSKFSHFFLVIFFFVISMLTNPAPRAFLPAYLLALFIFYFKKLTTSQKKTFVFGFGLIIFISFYLQFVVSASRFNQVSIFNTRDVTFPLEKNMEEEIGMAPYKKKYFYNKFVGIIRYIPQNFFHYINFDFLFLNGGFPEREVVPENGLFYLVDFPFFVLGLYYIFKKKREWGKLAICFVIFTTFILSFTADESPNSHRFFLVVLPIEIIIANGIYEFFANFRRKKFIFIPTVFLFLLLFFHNATFFIHQLFIHQPLRNIKSRGFAYQDLSLKLLKYAPSYKKIIITKDFSDPYIYLLFWTKFDPARYQAFGSPRDKDYSGFGKYVFVPISCPINSGAKPEKQVLYVNKGDCPPPKDSRFVDTVLWGDTSPAFLLLTSL